MSEVVDVGKHGMAKGPFIEFAMQSNALISLCKGNGLQ